MIATTMFFTILFSSALALTIAFEVAGCERRVEPVKVLHRRRIH